MKINNYNSPSFSLDFYPKQILFFLLFIVHSVNAQKNINTDSTEVTKLNEVIVTGENKVMSLSKKLFSVGVIDNTDIAKFAGNNLADILQFNLNISVIPDATTGRSTISLFGLDGQYVKILLDGIPMASDNGIGNNIDITQINLEDVERVEIVEGATGVLYGDNAVAGVINIVSKKDVKHKWQVQTSLQEETVGGEYAWFDKGKHIQNLKIGHKYNNYISANIGVSRNDFKGFFNTFKGQNYANLVDGIVENDGLRGAEWNPKEQITFFGNLNLKIKNHTFLYRLQSYEEILDIYSHIVNGRLDALGNANPTATDERYTTKRLVNNLNVYGPFLGKSTYNLSLSLQTQKRYIEEYAYNILQQGIERYTKDFLNQSTDILYSKGFISNILPGYKKVNLQLGYEFTNQSGFDAIASGTQSTSVVKNRLENYDFFGSSDFYITDKLALYPGARFTTNSQFGNKLIWSLSSTYDFTKKLKLKAVFGSAFRAPNFTELFYFFVDSNHNIQGNPNLQPEDGISYFLALENVLPLEDKGFLKSSFKFFFFDIHDKIEFVVADDDDIQFTYKNIDQFKTLGFSFENSLSYNNNWQINLGATYRGESSSIIDVTADVNKYLWSFSLTSGLSYTIPKLNTTLSASLKHNGRSQIYVLDDNDEVAVRQTNAFNFVDASIKTKLLQNLELTLGARNLADIIRVNATDIATGTHNSSTGGSRLLGYGRSYFIKILYNLNLN
ncbi:TonB-dependent receptor [uncultured Maribacter sp.]|uniref:TonB-dependent receptor plug domain-containing protein n=1 Tax=uncultured Maribacter sp. TaxID=431308 RepID=UPI00261598BD|nr:TonB-dependent receptor [uncultured Maribacter sp.]